VQEKTLPPHDQEVNEDEMDTDGDSVQMDEVVKYDEDGWFDDDPDFEGIEWVDCRAIAGVFVSGTKYLLAYVALSCQAKQNS
jgi:hypothetical protein